MKKPISTVLFITLLFLSNCDLRWGPPECYYEASFNFKADIPDINLAISDSVIIDMSKFWEAEVSCDIYTPIIKQAKGNKDLLQIRSLDEFLIIKGVQKGETEVSVIAERKNATFDTADCGTFSASAEPISFNISIGSVTDFESDKLSRNFNSRISSVNVTPKSFAKGDTVQLEYQSPQLSVSYSTWFTDSGTFISERSSSRSDCVDGYVISQSKKILMVVESEDQTIEGYVHNDDPIGNARKTGIYYKFQSQN